jgi:adenosylcobinamide-phosphate synthase
MKLEYQILAAVALDALVGDPQWPLHPVRLIGRLAQCLESPGRRLLRNQRLAGVVVALVVLGAAGLVSHGILVGAGKLHPLAGDVAAVLLIYVTVAARDLVKHSAAVYEALAAGDLSTARKRASLIVGRDTENLDESEVSRAAVESVAESTVDGVTAPLFFAFLGGPVGAVVYRAVNTLDSTFGYKDERYLRFGWASARLDDVANFLPARLTGPLMALAAALLFRRGGESWRILRRDAHRHSSPNAGIPEAAMAGALGVQLGGVSYYSGEPVEKPTIGDPAERLSREHIVRANRLMWVTLGLCLALCAGLRMAVLGLLGW